ncbi:hypothetical protein GCM10008956_14660 [Deinococcus arenae]|uniref:DUF4115 domain-containing protein n=1 Tax=Deinococcus arenae TaxID=1452751 RepID=A0A8H9GNJ7_9DEIO|nr:RodZ domain-containing protein [Deinococcus arenae]AWT36424.1 DUF4115 domain-containing protein [Deinococcus actinosclerus]GGM39293.1 hypothetical protein GCM10008956_14660 [Deinococcus arenae]
MTFGAALRQAREGMGLSVQDVALRTKIRGDYLRALEDGHLTALPERTFARSYLNRYARELGLDPQPLLADFDRVMPTPVSSRGPVPPVSRRTPPARRRLPVGLLVGLALLVVAGGAGYLVSQRTQGAPAVSGAATSEPAPAAATRTVRLTVKVTPPGARVYLDNRDLGAAPILAFPADARAQAELRVELAGREPLRQTVDVSRSRDLRVTLKPKGTPSVLSDAAQAQPRPAAAAPSGSAPAAAAAPDKTGAAATPPAQPGVKVTYSGPSWTRVTDGSGRIVFEGTPAAGTVKTFPKGITIRTGNAAAVKVSVDGAPGQPLGQSGQVVTRTF